MQAAIDAGVAQGQPLDLGAGITPYKITATLNITMTNARSFRLHGHGTGGYLNLTTSGVGIKVTVTQAGGYDPTLLSIDNLRITTTNSITKGIQILGNAVGAATVNVAIRRNWIQGGSAPTASIDTIGIEAATAYALVISENRIINMATAISIIDGTNGFHIIDNYITNYTRNGVLVDGTVSPISFGYVGPGNQIAPRHDGTNTPYGVHLKKTTAVMVVGNRYEDSAASGPCIGVGVNPDNAVGNVAVYTSIRENYFSVSNLCTAGINCAKAIQVGTYGRFTSYMQNFFSLRILTITGATNATPIAITTSTDHLLDTGDIVTIGFVGGNFNANGSFKITRTSATTFTLNNSVGIGTWTSGGQVFNPRIADITDRPGISMLEWASDGSSGFVGLDIPGPFMFGKMYNTQATPIYGHVSATVTIAGAVANPGAGPAGVDVTITVPGISKSYVPTCQVSIAIPANWIMSCFVSGFDAVKVRWYQVTGNTGSPGTDVEYRITGWLHDRN